MTTHPSLSKDPKVWSCEYEACVANRRAQRQYSIIIDISPQLFVDKEVTRRRRICDYYMDNPVS
jgi:hypothetical protein